MKRRGYEQRCGLAQALDLVGERWALLIVRELLLGPKRFSDLHGGLPRIGPNVLTQRLRELKAAGIVTRRHLAPPAGSWVYELTDFGRGLESALHALAGWGMRSARLDREAFISADSVMLGLHSAFDGARLKVPEGQYEIVLDDDPFSLTVAGGALSVRRGSTQVAPTRLTTDPPTLAALLAQSQTVDNATRAKRIEVVGDKDGLERLLRAAAWPTPTGDEPQNPPRD